LPRKDLGTHQALVKLIQRPLNLYNLLAHIGRVRETLNSKGLGSEGEVERERDRERQRERERKREREEVDTLREKWMGQSREIENDFRKIENDPGRLRMIFETRMSASA